MRWDCSHSRVNCLTAEISVTLLPVAAQFPASIHAVVRCGYASHPAADRPRYVGSDKGVVAHSAGVDLCLFVLQSKGRVRIAVAQLATEADRGHGGAVTSVITSRFLSPDAKRDSPTYY
jgi:hypothetical protein